MSDLLKTILQDGFLDKSALTYVALQGLSALSKSQYSYGESYNNQQTKAWSYLVN